MKKIYIVQGGTGQYEDKCSWLVRAFNTRGSASVYAGKCREWLVCEMKDKGYDNVDDWYYDCYPDIHPFDPDFYMDYTGTFYDVIEVDYEGETNEKS